MNLNLQTDWEIWPLLVYALLSIAIVMIRISEGWLESLGWRIIGILTIIGMLSTAYRYVMP